MKSDVRSMRVGNLVNVLETLSKHPDVSAFKFSMLLGATYSTTWYWLRGLEKAGLVECKRETRGRKYRLTDAGWELRNIFAKIFR